MTKATHTTMYWQSTRHEYRPAGEESYVRLTLSDGWIEGNDGENTATIQLEAGAARALISNLQYHLSLIEQHEGVKAAARAARGEEEGIYSEEQVLAQERAAGC